MSLRLARVCCLLPFLAVVAAADGDEPLTSRRLANGMTIVLAPDATAKSVAIHATFDAGSRRDPSKRDGTAWLANRLLGNRLTGFQADVNQERAVLAIETADVPAALRQLADAISDATVTTGELDRTRKTLIAEREAKASDAYAAVDAALLRLTYDARPHGHPANAAPTRVRRSDAQRFLRAHYAPASTVVAIAGAFDIGQVTTAIENTLGRIAPGAPRAACRPYRITRSTERRKTIIDTAAKAPQIALSYLTALAPEPDWYALNILADIIGQGPKSRLQVALVASGLAAQFGEGEAESPCAPSALRMRARLAPGGDVRAVETAIDRELDRLGRDLVSEEELRIAHEQERAWAAEQIASPPGVASAAARAALLYGDVQHLRREVGHMTAVTAEDVRRVASTYLRKSNRSVVVSLPTASR
jgi:zinc protease